MRISDINPFVRYARYLRLDKNSRYDEVVALDARVFYTIDGYGKIKVNGEEREMRRHSLLVINSGVAYRIEAPDESVEYIALNFDYTQSAAHLSVPVKPESVRSFESRMLIDARSFEDSDSLSGVLYVEGIDSIEKRLTQLVGEYMQKLIYHEAMCGHLLAECIFDALRFSQMGNQGAQKVTGDRIISFIYDHYSESLTNETVGRALGYHPNYVSFLVKSMTGMPLHRYVLHLRLMNAASLLENTAMSVSEVAARCGFCDAAYFSGYFKKHFGVAPSEYRK